MYLQNKGGISRNLFQFTYGERDIHQGGVLGNGKNSKSRDEGREEKDVIGMCDYEVYISICFNDWSRFIWNVFLCYSASTPCSQ